MKRRVEWATRLLVLIGFIWSAAGCASKLTPQQRDAQMAARLDAILTRQSKSGATFAARVIELPSRRELYAVNIDRPMIPASNLKLFCTTTGLDRFGPDYKFKTFLAMDGNDLWIIGTGDPGVGDPKLAARHHEKITAIFDEWLRAMRKRDITHVPGKLIYYQGAMDGQWVHPSWSKSFAGDWYAAPVTGLTLCDNCYEITLKVAHDGRVTGYGYEPTAKNIKIVNKCTQPSTRPADIEREFDANVYNIVRSWDSSQRKGPISKAVVDPGAYFADAFRTYLEEHGVNIDGATVESKTPLDGSREPAKEKTIAVHETPMKAVLWRILKHSQNLFAEALAKLNGQQYQLDTTGKRVPGSWTDGSAAAHHFLQANGIDDSKIVLVDGSGLSRQDRVTTHAITDLLAVMQQHPYWQTFYDSLPIAGEDGTISDRMKDIAGKVRAKTGYIGGVRSLSGYVHCDDGRVLAFSIIFNNIPDGVKPFEAIQDDACRVMVRGVEK